MYNFHYVFPIKVMVQPDLCGGNDVKVSTKEYDYAVDVDKYWDLVAKEFINDWFSLTYDQLNPDQQQFMFAEARDLCLTQDYYDVYDDSIHEKLLEEAWKYFCETQMVLDKDLYQSVSFEVIKELNGYYVPQEWSLKWRVKYKYE